MPWLDRKSLLVGWQLPGAVRAQQLRARKALSLEEILAGQGPTTPTPPPPKQHTLSALISVSLRLPEVMPLALIAGFYQGQQVGLGLGTELYRRGQIRSVLRHFYHSM